MTKFLYFGDDDMTRAAAYLCGIMTHAGFPFERVDSAQSPTDALLQEPYNAFILSDYPRERFQPGQLETICSAVNNGAGLVMFGGWESYHGLLGEYHNRAVNTDLLISIFHAQGQIWPELGPPVSFVPKLYEYPTYNDFAAPPTMRVRVSEDLVEKRLAGIALFKSQLQIDLLVNELRRAGGNEYLYELTFEVFSAKKYESLF